MQERAETSYEVGKKEHESDLRTVGYRCTLLLRRELSSIDCVQLWRNMKPDVELKSMVTKQWQDVSLSFTLLCLAHMHADWLSGHFTINRFPLDRSIRVSVLVFS